jgi:enoyl-CoA hydratase/carnithine racemase
MLQQERHGPAAWLWLDRPERRNALNAAMLHGLEQAFRALAADETVRAVVLAARGRGFCAGLDLGWLNTLMAGDMAAEVEQLAGMLAAVDACPQPLIAAVQGAAIGGGLLLAMAADFCLAAPEATFSGPEVELGIFPALGLVPRLERRVGLAAARRLLLLGERLDADEALRLGLVYRVVPAGALVDEAGALAERLAALPALALQRTKAAFDAARRPGYEAWEAEQVRVCWESPERQAALARFLRRG